MERLLLVALLRLAHGATKLYSTGKEFVDPGSNPKIACRHMGTECRSQPPIENGLPLSSGRPANCSSSQLRGRFLMVPKNGCETTARFFDIKDRCEPSKRRWVPNNIKAIDFGAGRSHWRFYTNCSIAIVREPCSRVASIYRHLKCMYSKHASYAREEASNFQTPDGYASLYSRRPVRQSCTCVRPTCRRPPWCHRGYHQLCRQHWIHTTNSIDDFVLALRDRWADVLDLRRRHYFDRHLTIALPQSMYIGPRSWVLCTEHLSSDLPVVARELCPPAINRTVARLGHHLQSCSSIYNVSRTALSAKGCSLVRQLYKHDYVLWQRHCEGREGTRS